MTLHSRSRRARESTRLSYAIKSADDGSKAEYDTKMPAALSPEDWVTYRQLTLDDFGGRSNALGG